MATLYLSHRVGHYHDIIQHRKLMLNFNDAGAMIGLNISIKSLFEVITYLRILIVKLTSIKIGNSTPIAFNVSFLLHTKNNPSGVFLMISLIWSL